MSPSDDRTVIRPMPGGRSTASQAPIANDLEAVQSLSTQSPLNMTFSGIDNPLENAAGSLLVLLGQLQSAEAHHNTDVLRENIAHEIRRFQERALAQNVDRESVYTARYVLCTVLDEAVLNTPWGQNSNWAQNSLLSSFHKEVSGGEKFFHLLKTLATEPAKNIHLLELMYVCLSMGFEGRYRIVEGGQDKLGRIRQWLYQTIQSVQGSPETTLSPHTQGVTDQRNRLLHLIPVWIIALLVAGLLATLFTTFLLRLNQASDPVMQQLSMVEVRPMQRLELAPEVPVKPLPPPPQPTITLSDLLAGEINEGILSVDEDATQGLVTLQGDGLFRSGDARVRDDAVAVFQRITEALNEIPGAVLITGHTDDVPIRSLRFPSNWHLSQERAQSVETLMQQWINDPERLRTEGRADLEPLVPNTSAAARAMNRRVEVLLKKTPPL